MNKSIFNTIIGALAALVVVGLLVFSIEEKKSIIQIFFGFIFFVIPFSFMSSFASKIMSFLLTSFSIVFGYIIYKIGFLDVWIGIVQALVIGGAIYYFRIRTTKTFSAKNYKEEANKQNSDGQ